MEQTRLLEGQHCAKFLVLSLHFLLSQGSPRLTILNSLGYFVFEEGTECEVQFSVEDAWKNNMSYKIFINHKLLGRNISRLKCYLNKTPDNCSSSSKDCECLEQTPQHVYKLKKHVQEDDGGEWIFVLNGKGLTDETAINITVLSRGRGVNNTTGIMKSGRGTPKLTLVNGSTPLIIDENTTSEIYFSITDVKDDNLRYLVFINHEYPGSNVSRLKCILNTVSGNCSSNNKDCVCVNKKSGHQYKLKKVFQEKDSGEWTFSVSGKGFSHDTSLNISVISLAITTQNLQTSSKEPGSGLRGPSGNTLTQTSIPMSNASSPASTTHITGGGITHGWHIAVIVLATFTFIAVFGLVVACTTWRCASVHLERWRSERLACLAGVNMAESYLLSMNPVYDVIPATFHLWRSPTSRRTQTTNKAPTSAKSPGQPSPPSTILMSV